MLLQAIATLEAALNVPSSSDAAVASVPTSREVVARAARELLPTLLDCLKAVAVNDEVCRIVAKEGGVAQVAALLEAHVEGTPGGRSDAGGAEDWWWCCQVWRGPTAPRFYTVLSR